MILKNHIVYSFLLNDNRAMEIIHTMHGRNLDPDNLPEEVYSLYHLASPKDQKAYLCTQTMLDHLEKLKVARGDGTLDWSIFSNLGDRKVTFIFPNNQFLRMWINKETIAFMHVTMELEKGSKDYGQMNWVLFYLDKYTGITCEHFQHNDVKAIETFIYRLLCFMYLTENEEVHLKVGEKKGTKKSGKIINNLPVPVTIVDSKWNITSIRTDGFDVSGHFRLQPCGTDMQQRKIIYIQPFKKEGYTRGAKSKE